MSDPYALYEEAQRLVHKFFPESRSIFSLENGFGIYQFIQAMKFCDFQSDYSCDYFQIPNGPDTGLADKGGFNEEPDEIYRRLLDHVRFKPMGRCVIIPDLINPEKVKGYQVLPIICDARRVADRLVEADLDPENAIFGATSFDTLFVYESGEAMAVDHDNRFFWARSRKNRSRNK